MPYEQDVKELAYTIDPPCWVSYSGKGRFFKAAMEDRRNKALKQAQAEIDRIKESRGQRHVDTDHLPHPDLLAATVSCSGTEITIQCDDHDVKDRLMDFLIGN
ncbi:hypothetical protein [Bradyrhizobium sp. DASA03007]|uniref:hypothetical protein n=1 Tax=unclassified Bradyrhizobium TaxID=2631580 RepID=UPI003F72E474